MTDNQTQEQEIEHVREIVARRIGENFHNLRLANFGGMSYVFYANHGTPDGELRVIKADRITKASPRLERYAQRGCGTARDSRILASLPEARKHHIVRLLHYYPEEDGIAISELDHIDGETLEEKLSKGPLVPGHSQLVLTNLLDAANYYSQRGFLHRDIKPENIIIENGTDEAYLLDFGCSSEKSCPQDRNLTTYGKRIIADPLLVEKLTGIKRIYSEDSEIHCLAEIGVRSLVGEYVYRCNPDLGMLSDNNLFSLLNKDGTINVKTCNTVLDSILESLPKESRKLAPAFRRALTLDETLRYGRDSAIAEFTQDFLNAIGLKSVENPRIKERRFSRRSVVLGGLGALALASAIGGVGVYGVSRLGNLEREREEALKYKVVPDWKGNLGVQSNLIELETSIYDVTGKKSASVNDKTTNLVETCQGDKLEIGIKMTEKPFPKTAVGGLPKLVGAVYIEGFDKVPFRNWSQSDKPEDFFSEGYAGPISIDLIVPNIPDGCYTFAVDVYAPIESDFDEHDSRDVYKSLRFQEPGRVIARDRIPIIIGKPEIKVALDRIGLGLGEDAVFKRIGGAKEESKLTYEFNIPGIGFNRVIGETKNGYHIYPGEMKFPNLKHETRDMFQYVVRDKSGKIATFGMIPIKNVKLENANESQIGFLTRMKEFFGFAPENKGTDYYIWQYDFPGRDFPDKLKEFYTKISAPHK